MSKVYWVTGISGVGKTTFANILRKQLDEKKIVNILIDGDEIREILKKENSYSRENRIELAMIYSKLAKLISDQGVTVIVSTISLIKEIHLWNKQNLKNYIEILIKRDISEIIKNDDRNIYKESEVVGVSIDAEYPENANFVLENIKIDEIEKYIRKHIL